jgi:uncharacterized protein
MRIENEFVVPAPIDRVWDFLLDVERVAPCMPGAELTEVVDDRTWKGRTNVKVGPVSLSFAGTVSLRERDDAGHRVVLNAKGMEQRGKGAATASVVSRLEETDRGTRVFVDADLTISGAIAQYGRGMLEDVSRRLAGEFAKCLEATMAGEGEPSNEAPTAAGASPDASRSGEATNSNPAASARPVRGVRLAVWALWRAVVRFFRRLIRSGS